MKRRHSFPPVGAILLNRVPPPIPATKIKRNNNYNPQEDDDMIIVLGPVKPMPLTEENLALHTKNFPPNKDARRRNTRLFVQEQMSIILLQLKLERQRIQEIESLRVINTPEVNVTTTHKRKQIHHATTCDVHISWLQRLKRIKWIRSLVHPENKLPIKTKYHRETCQKRDSGISFFISSHGKRRSSSSIVKQQQQQNDDFIAYRYPKMIRKENYDVPLVII